MLLRLRFSKSLGRSGVRQSAIWGWQLSVGTAGAKVAEGKDPTWHWNMRCAFGLGLWRNACLLAVREEEET